MINPIVLARNFHLYSRNFMESLNIHIAHNIYYNFDAIGMSYWIIAGFNFSYKEICIF